MTISAKYRRLGESEEFPANFLRHCYDVYCLLGPEEIQAFMHKRGYQDHKAQRFRSGDELVIARNPTFVLDDPGQKARFAREYRKTSALYYQGQPDFDLLVTRIHQYINVV